MWISEALRQPPKGGWTMTIAAWLRTICLALAAVMTGAGLDATINTAWSSPAWPSWIMAGCLVVMAASAGAVAEGLLGIVQGREERSWRARLMKAFLADRLQLPDGLSGQPASAQQVRHSLVEAAAAESERPASVPAGRPSQPGERSVAHSGGRHGGQGGGHPGGQPGKAVTVDGLMLDAATEGVEKTAFYRAMFLSPTLASFTAPILVLVIWIVLIDAISGLIVVPFVALVPLLISVVGKWLRRSTNEYRRKQAQTSSSYLEMIDGLGTLTVLDAVQRARDEFARAARDVAATITKLLSRNQATIVVNDLVFGLIMTGSAVALISWRFANGAMTTGNAFAALLMTVLLAEPIDRLGRNFYVGLGGRARRDGLEELLTQEGEVEFQQATSASSAPAVQLQDVAVTKAGKPILGDINLEIPAGSHVAIVGPTGVGKTTLLRVISGLEEPTGSVLVDGRETPAAERRAISTTLSQRAGILSTTIADNLRIAAPDASREELAAACQRAHLDLSVFPDGLDTCVGEQGALLSGGQRRRIALARTLLRDRQLLILDEPTADLDRRTEALVRDTIQELTRGRTVVHVAHRLSMIGGADLVVVLRDGRIVDVGTPAELAQRPGFVRDSLAAEGARA